MSIAKVKSDLAHLAATIKFDPVQIPSELAAMAPMDAIHARLTQDAAKFGGYRILAQALPMHSAKIWESKIERVGRFKLTVDNFVELIRTFDDMVPVALLAGAHDWKLINLNPIPASQFSSADLAWTLRSLSAEGTLVCCEMREALLDGEDTTTTRAKLIDIAKKSMILLHQLGRDLQARLDQPRKEA
jgi:hypothetical protein